MLSFHSAFSVSNPETCMYLHSAHCPTSSICLEQPLMLDTAVSPPVQQTFSMHASLSKVGPGQRPCTAGASCNLVVATSLSPTHLQLCPWCVFKTDSVTTLHCHVLIWSLHLYSKPDCKIIGGWQLHSPHSAPTHIISWLAPACCIKTVHSMRLLHTGIDVPACHHTLCSAREGKTRRCSACCWGLHHWMKQERSQAQAFLPSTEKLPPFAAS